MKIFIWIIQEVISRERQILLEKLSTIFDPETANDYVSPKTNEIRQQLTLEQLRLRMYIESLLRLVKHQVCRRRYKRSLKQNRHSIYKNVS
jgi:thymidylate synthase ThyX